MRSIQVMYEVGRPWAAALLLLAVPAPTALAGQAAPTGAAAEERPEGAVRLGLEEAVRRAVTYGEDVLMARAERARIEGQVKEVRARSLPEISAEVGYTRNIQRPVIFFETGEGVEQIAIGNDNDYAFGLSFSQPLLDLSIGPARRAARLSEDATAAQVASARRTTGLQAKLEYFTVLLDERLVEVQEQALAQARARLEELEMRFEAGTASEFDVLTARVEVDNIRPQLLEARNRLELDRLRLRRTVNVPADVPLVLTDSLRPPEAVSPPAEELSEALARAFEQRSDLRSQATVVELQRANLDARRGEAWPSVDLTASLARQASSADLFPEQRDFSQSATAGLALSLPLFDGRARSGRVQQARAAVEREGYRLEQLREDVGLEVQQALQTLGSARERVEASASNVGRAERALEIAQERFRSGLSTQLELDDAELAVTRARTNHAQALFEYNAAVARLEAAVGEW